jgi:hypothetical protein
MDYETWDTFIWGLRDALLRMANVLLNVLSPQSTTNLEKRHPGAWRAQVISAHTPVSGTLSIYEPCRPRGPPGY